MCAFADSRIRSLASSRVRRFADLRVPRLADVRMHESSDSRIRGLLDSRMHGCADPRFVPGRCQDSSLNPKLLNPSSPLKVSYNKIPIYPIFYLVRGTINPINPISY